MDVWLVAFGRTAESILTPGVPVALRMSGHLLLGLAKIYQLQVNYLYVDCNSVISKIKQVSGDVLATRGTEPAPSPALTTFRPSWVLAVSSVFWPIVLTGHSTRQ